MNLIGAVIICILMKFSSASAESIRLAVAGVFSCTALYTARSISSFSPINSKQIVTNTILWNALFFISVSIAAIGITLVFFSGNEFHGRRRIQTTEAAQIIFAIGIAFMYLMRTIRAHKVVWKQAALFCSRTLDEAYELYDNFVFIFDRKYFFREAKKKDTDTDGVLSIMAGSCMLLGIAGAIFFVAFLRLYVHAQIFDISGSIVLVAIASVIAVTLVSVTAPRYFTCFGVGICSATALYVALLLI